MNVIGWGVATLSSLQLLYIFLGVFVGAEFFPYYRPLLSQGSIRGIGFLILLQTIFLPDTDPGLRQGAWE